MREDLNALANRLKSADEIVTTEEATKTGFIFPFLRALGYDVFDPSEVVPEFTADIGRRKGEKVDIAIMQEGQPSILIECKKLGEPLDPSHATQLRRYFNTVDARIAILTNGREYMFFTDLDRENNMDEQPFFVIDIENLDDQDLRQLEKFKKSAFNEEEILSTASQLKYMRALEGRIEAEFANPSDEFVKLIASDVGIKRWTSGSIEQFRTLIKRAFKHYLSEKMRDQFERVISGQDEPEEAAPEELKIVTTQEEIDGFNIIRAIVADTIDPARVYMRDRQSYCGIIIDDNNRKPLARLHFNTSKWRVGLFDGDQEERVDINSLNDIFKLAERLKVTARKYVDD